MFIIDSMISLVDTVLKVTFPDEWKDMHLQEPDQRRNEANGGIQMNSLLAFRFFWFMFYLTGMRRWVSHTGVASLCNSTFGGGITVIPWFTDMSMFSDWQLKNGFYQVAYEKNQQGIVWIAEFTLGAVISSGPILPLSQRHQQLNEYSKGEYFKLKNKLENGDGRFRTDLLKKIKQWQKQMGIDLWSKDEEEEEKQFKNKLLVLDLNAKLSEEKRYRFKSQQCNKLCNQVVRQDEETRQYNLHLEFGFLKQIDEPPDDGHIISSEPLYVADHLLPILWSGEPLMDRTTLKDWVVHFRNVYGLLFYGLRPQQSIDDGLFHYSFSMSTQQLLEKFESSSGTSISWKTLLTDYGIMKDFLDIDFPHLRRDHILQETLSGHQQYKKIIGSTPIGRLKSLKGPTVLTLNSIGGWRDENLAFLRALAEQQLKEGSSHDVVDMISNYRLSLPHLFTAYMYSSDGVRFQLLPLYAGLESSLQKDVVHFLFISLSHKEVTKLNQRLKDMILMIWGSYVVKRYRKDMKSKLYGCSPRTEKEIRDHSAMNRDGRKQGSILSCEDIAPIIEFVSISYIGMFHLVCWRDISGKSENKLAFLVQPREAKIYRDDGTSLIYKLTGNVSVVSFFEHGLVRLVTGEDDKDAFKSSLLQHNSAVYHLLYSTLVDVFKFGKNMSMFERNTCELQYNSRRCSFFSSSSPSSSSPSSDQRAIELLAEEGGTVLWNPSCVLNDFEIFLEKCFSRVIPSSCVEQNMQNLSSTNTFMECVQIPALRFHVLVERRR